MLYQSRMQNRLIIVDDVHTPIKGYKKNKDCRRVSTSDIARKE